MKKNYIGFVRDHSGSMNGVRKAAMEDYNNNLGVIKDAAIREKQNTIISVVKCGMTRTRVQRAETLANVQSVKPISGYETEANTPLWDSVGDLIEQFENVPDAKDEDVSFLILVITDGEENASINWSGDKLAAKIKKLNATDRWTFTFRVPRGHSHYITRIGIPAGNVLEWETTEEGLRAASVATRQAVNNYYSVRTLGTRSVDTFYTDLTGVKPAEVKRKLVNISNEVKVWDVKDDGEIIREFVERKSRKKFLKGAAFYQLTKTEKKVQDYKTIVIRDKKTGEIYSGVEARNLLGLPHNGDVKVVPGNHGGYDIFVQSTSVNRKLPIGTQVLYWEKVGTPYIEGVSSPWGR